MKDALGRDVELNDIVVTSYQNGQISVWQVVGFTPQKLVLQHIRGSRAYIPGDVRKPSNEVAVIVDGLQLLQES